jgi:hypothetical protein
MKRQAHFLKSVLALAAAVLVSEEFAVAQSALPPPALIQPAAPPPAAAIHATVPAPAAPPRRALTFADLKAQFPQNKDGQFLMEVPSIVNTSTDREAQSLLTGQSVETTGQLMPETIGNADGKSLRITRSQLQCCAEHARQCSVALQFSEKAPALKELAWVRLVGTISYKQEDGKTVPVVIVKEIKEIAAPKNQLLQ